MNIDEFEIALHKLISLAIKDTTCTGEYMAILGALSNAQYKMNAAFEAGTMEAAHKIIARKRT